MKFFDSFLILMFMCSQPFYPFKDLSILRIQRSYREIFTAHYDCRNGELSFIPLK